MDGHQHHPAQATGIDPDSGLLLAGTSIHMREMDRAIGDLAHADVNLIVHGEPGTGKRAAAEEIHRRGPHADRPFCALWLAGLTEAEAERELFGEEGAAARTARVAGGTVYLDAIESLPLALQRRLAVAIADGGAWSSARVVGGTAASLDEVVRIGHFRRDLFFRLGVVGLTIPPLRERREDIPVLAERLAAAWCKARGLALARLGGAAVAELTRAPWPGNARELRQVVDNALAASRDGEIRAERIRSLLGRRPRWLSPPEVFPLRQLERDYIAAVLASCNWNQSLAARRLGIGRNTLMRKIKSFGLGRPTEEAA
jgi:DNA-binding NtrC family response regulator